jgi:hypothetical protein
MPSSWLCPTDLLVSEPIPVPGEAWGQAAGDIRSMCSGTLQRPERVSHGKRHAILTGTGGSSPSRQSPYPEVLVAPNPTD